MIPAFHTRDWLVDGPPEDWELEHDDALAQLVADPQTDETCPTT